MFHIIIYVIYYYEKRKGNPLLFGYHAYNYSSLDISKDDLLTLMLSNSLEKSIPLHTFETLAISLLSGNDIEKEDQYVLLVFCAFEENCEYNIIYADYNIGIDLKDLEKYSLIHIL